LNRDIFCKSENKNVLVIGLGQLGLPVAKYIKENSSFDVYGYDISRKAMERAERLASIKKLGDHSDFDKFDVFIVCVSTHKADDMFTPEIDNLLSVVKEKIAKEGKNDALVSIESTIPRGTSRKIFEILNHRMHVAHVPHRWYGLEEEEHGVNQLRVVGGVCDCCLKAAVRFYSGYDDRDGDNDNAEGRFRRSDNAFKCHGKGLGIPLHLVSNIEIAEITKIAENAHRYLQIAFAEDLYLYCQANSISFPELRDALNTKWNVNILEPRDGIGGHCLPKDTRMFLESSRSTLKSKILSAAINVDQDYRRQRHRPVRDFPMQMLNQIRREQN